MTVRVEWTGDEFVEKVVKDILPDALSQAGAYMNSALRAEIRAQDLVDTGFFINSIEDKATGPQVHRVGTNAHYAVYLEYGTKRMDAKAPMRKAMEDGTNKSNVLKIVEAALGGAG